MEGAAHGRDGVREGEPACASGCVSSFHQDGHGEEEMGHGWGWASSFKHMQVQGRSCTCLI